MSLVVTNDMKEVMPTPQMPLSELILKCVAFQTV